MIPTPPRAPPPTLPPRPLGIAPTITGLAVQQTVLLSETVLTRPPRRWQDGVERAPHWAEARRRQPLSTHRAAELPWQVHVCVCACAHVCRLPWLAVCLSVCLSVCLVCFGVCLHVLLHVQAAEKERSEVDNEALALSLSTTNAIFLLAVVVITFFVLRNTTPTVNYIGSTVSSGIVVLYLATRSK